MIQANVFIQTRNAGSDLEILLIDSSAEDILPTNTLCLPWNEVGSTTGFTEQPSDKDLGGFVSFFPAMHITSCFLRQSENVAATTKEYRWLRIRHLAHHFVPRNHSTRSQNEDTGPTLDVMVPWTRTLLQVIASHRKENTAGKPPQIDVHKLQQALATLTQDTPTQVAHGVEVLPVLSPTLPPARHTNCYWVGTHEFYCVDPGAIHPEEKKKIITHIKSRVAAGQSFCGVLLTHHHGDHIGSAQDIATEFSVPVLAHVKTKQHLTQRVTVDTTLRHKDLLGHGKDTIEVLETPGHASGHLCFLYRASRSVVCGDMVAGKGTILIEPKDGNMTAYLDSLALLQTVDATVLLPAHGPPLHPNHLSRYIEHRRQREAKIFAAIQKIEQSTDPADITTITTHTYDDVHSALHSIAQLSVQSHVDRLIALGKITHDRGLYRAILPA